MKNNKLILKAQQSFKSGRHNAFTEEINRIVLNSNDDKRMQSIDSIVSVKEEIKCSNIIKQYKK